MPAQAAPAPPAGAAPAGRAPPPPGRFDLSRMRALLAGMGDPQDRVEIVHVAGTKGKGSVAAMLASILRAAGLRVGVYTSPHMHTIRERIQAPAAAAPAGANSSNGGGGATDDTRGAAAPPIISERDFASLAAAARAAAAALPAPPSHFEAVTAMALAHFADARADIAVIETGMGGATDATNVAPAGKLAAAVITAIGWDHVDALGGSLESISAAKAGILRPGRPAVIAAQPHAAAAASLRAAAAAAAAAPVVDVASAARVGAAGPVRLAAGPGWQLARQAVNVDAALPALGPGAAAGGSSGSEQQQGQGQEQRLSLKGVDMGLVGAHQRANAAAAVAAALQLRAAGWPLPDAAVRAGLEAAALPGRFQVARFPPKSELGGGGGDDLRSQAPEQGQPYVVLDGAHTPESGAALAAALREAFPPPAALALVVAMAGDKAHREFVAALRAARPGVVVFTSAPIAGSTQRSAPPGTLAAHWQAAAMLAGGPPLRCRELIQAGVGAALERARREVLALSHQRGGGGGGGPPAVVCVTGSLHAVAAATRALREADA
ncbi:MAG: FolC bifunctional protein [Monoraphidium minutum]|nr:MAG: FolC bifunctional protein [Monoraphidium minutum]